MKSLKVFKGYVDLLESADELREYFLCKEDNSLQTFDWETTGLEFNATPLGLALHQRGSNPIFAPTDYFFKRGIPMEDIADICNEQFKRLRLIAHNAKYDSMINVMNGIKDENCNIVADTLIMIHLYDPSLEKKLEKRVSIDFGYEKETFEKISGKKWPKINWAKDGDLLLEQLAGYAGEDTFWETKVYYKYEKLLDPHAKKMLKDMEMPMVKILRDAKIRGILIDIPLLHDMQVELANYIDNVKDQIFDEAGCIFNLNSPRQKQEVFFNKLKLPIVGYTKTKAPSTDSDTFQVWCDMGYAIGEQLVKYSELGKLYSGYVLAIPKLVDSENVLRGDLNSCGTTTSRFSSSNPNLQNQPNNDDFPIRKAFIPRPGYVFINYDYSQLELRVMAHIAKDKTLTEVFMHGGDPHGDVAKRLGISRKNAKTCNFGVLYGLGIPKFAKKFGVSDKKAAEIIDNYHKTYYGFAKWKEGVEKFAAKNGFVKTLFGFRRTLPDALKSPTGSEKWKYFSAMRQAVNTEIQGTAAGIVKLATIACCRKLNEHRLDCHFLLQVHDELLFEVRIDQMLEAEKIIIECMENTVKLDVPLKVDGKIILNWSEMKSDEIVTLPNRFDYSLYNSLLYGVV